MTTAGLAIGIDEGAHDAPLVLLLHGFPELPSSWRHQVTPLVDAGYHVVAPYLLGYGDSPRPDDPQEYTADKLAAGVVEVIDRCGAERAVVIGHDWGAALTWATAQLHPDRVRAMVAMAVPITARSQKPPIERLREVMGESFFYMIHFQEPGVADAELAADVRGFLLGMYAATSGTPPEGALQQLPASSGRFVDQLPVPDAMPAFLDAAAFAEAVATFERTGFTGGLNHYRAMDPTWHQVPQLGTVPITCPVGFLAGEKDLVLAFTPTRALGPPLVPDLRMDVRVPGVGHWVQQEAPDAVNRALLGFLAGIG
ncbi:MAG TPA: alpha/beta hydrolase [Mycobacteriales bacterium]|nr:alpha/beta hydrolase [Mycobacteriales bacterium]